MLCTPVGGSHEYVGLTGRKIIFDTYDGIFTVKHPIEYGTIMNWTYVENQAPHFLQRVLATPDEHPPPLGGQAAGGSYTHAIDVGTDLSGKNEYVSEQDDNRNTVPIADNVLISSRGFVSDISSSQCMRILKRWRKCCKVFSPSEQCS